MPIRIEDDAKLCLNCGRLMYRRRYRSRLEAGGDWASRRFCSLSCSNRKRYFAARAGRQTIKRDPPREYVAILHEDRLQCLYDPTGDFDGQFLYAGAMAETLRGGYMPVGSIWLRFSIGQLIVVDYPAEMTPNHRAFCSLRGDTLCWPPLPGFGHPEIVRPPREDEIKNALATSGRFANRYGRWCAGTLPLMARRGYKGYKT